VIDGPEFITGSLRTSDPASATQQVAEIKAELQRRLERVDSVTGRFSRFDALSELEQDKLILEMNHAIKQLPPDERRPLGNAREAKEFLKSSQDDALAASFIEAGAGAKEEIEELVTGIQNPIKEFEKTADLAMVDALRRESSKKRRVLLSAGFVNPDGSEIVLLNEVLQEFLVIKKYVDEAGNVSQTGEQYRYAVRRFVEFTGDLRLEELTKSHIREFAYAFTKLPKSSRRDIRPLPFNDAVRVAEKEGLDRVSERTRDQNLTLLKSLMAFACAQGYRNGDSPWEGYTVPKTRTKFSSSTKKWEPFSASQIALIFERTQRKRHNQTVDYWAPLLAAYHGMREEEIAQLTVGDVKQIDAILCISVTDQEESQKVKSAAAVRTIPVHRDVIAKV
jgi:hypothetical protein